MTMRTINRASGGGDKVGSLRVCHLVSATNGARWAVEQLSWLRDRYGHDVTAVVGGSNGSLIDMLKEAGIRVHAEEGFGAYDSVASVLRLPAAVWRLAWWLRRERFDVVQSHLLFAMIATRFAAWFADVPVRLAMYASPFHLEVPRTFWMDRLTWWTETRLIASCKYTDDILARLGVASARRAVIYYGADNDQYDPDKTPAVDLRAEYGWPSSTKIVVKVAYFYAKMSDNDWVPAVLRGKNPKGFVDLVRATPAILAKHPETKVVLVGNGWGEPGTAYMEEVRHLVQDLGLSESIIFTGFRRDTAGILRGADVAVQASLYENVGGVIESLMVECPTVATAVCGMVDCVIDGETGILVRPSDPADLARGINDMLCDRPRARALAASGGLLARERFSLARTCADLDQLYRSERSVLRRRFYNPLVSLARCAIGVPILAWFVLRVAHRDFYMTSHWPTHPQPPEEHSRYDLQLRYVLAVNREPASVRASSRDVAAAANPMGQSSRDRWLAPCALAHRIADASANVPATADLMGQKSSFDSQRSTCHRWPARVASMGRSADVFAHVSPADGVLARQTFPRLGLDAEACGTAARVAAEWTRTSGAAADTD
ncbi:glycosyltransferase family 4 protein [Bradyrhizobium diazoefficiens]|uniref:glycosyltransferase family 4 protein n=1 Tax=Bradyrhizobium diazoefficiens TaxID=1355477 RepID=UPI002B45F75A|nr:glycosyltransferase family 4 protein [Bradyrhizobium diazoefficiens]WRJ43223.1 glycosyltransferase family 4 protein [Bradyrhizobium diazoefficiens]